MVLNDWKDKVMSMFSRKEGGGTRRPDGGTSCYRPLKRRSAQEPAAQGREADQQPMTYVHTGFTGMNPPVSYGGMQDSGRNPAYGQTGYNQAAYDQTAWQPNAYSQATGYMQQSGPYTAFPGDSRNAYGSQNTYFQNRPEPEERTASRPERGWFPPRETPLQQNNISYMPGLSPDAGSSFTHVEHIMTMTGLRSCYEAIACMKNGETLIVMMDAIANDSESMRCQDMLAGAAFTLGCSVRMLQGGRLVLIAPEGVKVLPEQAQFQPEVPFFASAPAPQVQPAETAPARRERRTGARAEEWNAARNGQLNNYNPYTGTMPVAAGAYGSFGGYGY